MYNENKALVIAASVVIPFTFVAGVIVVSAVCIYARRRNKLREQEKSVPPALRPRELTDMRPDEDQDKSVHRPRECSITAEEPQVEEVSKVNEKLVASPSKTNVFEPIFHSLSFLFT